MKRSVFLAVWLAAMAAFGGFDFRSLDLTKAVKDTGKVLHSATGVGLQEELTIGNSVAVEIVSRYGGLLRDEAITRRVNLVGKSLVASSARPELEFRFGVLNSPSVNAFSAPGGDVFITKGLYDLVQNDDQLAGVLAHEIAHVTERHAINIIRKGEFREGLAGWGEQAGTAAGKADVVQYSKGVDQVTKVVVEKGFDPNTEFEADKVGAKLAMMVGYAPDGLEQCLKTLQQHETGKTTFFPTHPPLKKRIEKLDAQAKR